MKGYYKRPDLTAAVIDKDGWINTGDIGVWTHRGEYAIKDVRRIRSSSRRREHRAGPIESRIRESEDIEQAVVVGQDQKYLAALIVPDTKQLELYVKDNNIPTWPVSTSRASRGPRIAELRDQRMVSAKNGFKSFERINRFGS
jgi:long-chain acyl-CoA synthetase